MIPGRRRKSDSGGMFAIFQKHRETPISGEMFAVHQRYRETRYRKKLFLEKALAMYQAGLAHPVGCGLA